MASATENGTMQGHVRAPAGRAPGRRWGDLKRPFFIVLGAAAFLSVYLLPLPDPAVDPTGTTFLLGKEGKASLALFLLAVIWWIAEVAPIGVTGAAIVALQAIFLIRPARTALTDFMDPAVWFITGSLIIGMVVTKTGLARRAAYRTLVLVGERTGVILLGCFLLTTALTLVMAHTAVAATVYPLFMAIHSLYSEENQPTRFGKGLFIGMAFVAGAGSIITLLGSARAVVASGFFREITGRQVGFLEVTWYMLPVGAVMVLFIWAFTMLLWHPEKKTIPGLQERARRLHASLGPMTRREKLAIAVVAAAVAALVLGSAAPAFRSVEQGAILISAAVLFFLFGVLDLEDLEGTPLNIIFLFGGTMSLGHCLWQTGASQWLAVKLLVVCAHTHWLVFTTAVALAVMLLTNLILNVALIAIALPVALVIAPYLGIAPEVVLFSVLAAAGMPFLTLIGAAPNAIAYGSNQFTQQEFFRAGVPVSIALVLMLALFMALIWPAMGMPVLLGH